VKRLVPTLPAADALRRLSGLGVELIRA